MKVLRSKCEADVYLEVISGTTGKTYTASGIEAQVHHSCRPRQRGLPPSTLWSPCQSADMCRCSCMLCTLTPAGVCGGW
jgi:hypothetical protein